MERLGAAGCSEVSAAGAAFRSSSGEVAPGAAVSWPVERLGAAGCGEVSAAAVADRRSGDLRTGHMAFKCYKG